MSTLRRHSTTELVSTTLKTAGAAALDMAKSEVKEWERNSSNITKRKWTVFESVCIVKLQTFVRKWIVKQRLRRAGYHRWKYIKSVVHSTKQGGGKDYDPNGGLAPAAVAEFRRKHALLESFDWLSTKLGAELDWRVRHKILIFGPVLAVFLWLAFPIKMFHAGKYFSSFHLQLEKWSLRRCSHGKMKKQPGENRNITSIHPSIHTSIHTYIHTYIL